MRFYKYSASGNDFVVTHTEIEKDRKEWAKKICDRHNGVGADGLIVIIPSISDEYNFKWQFYNSDGSEPSMCGNGSRACAHYAFVNKLAKNNMKFLTKAGIISANIEENIVEVELTPYKKISSPFDEMGFKWHFYDTGVPHLVTIVDSLDKFNLDIARKIRYNRDSNVNFMAIKDNGTFQVRTYERGVEDETLACGTGIAACFCVANELGLINKNAKVLPKSGEELFVRLENDKIFFKGKVSLTFCADISKELNEGFI